MSSAAPYTAIAHRMAILLATSLISVAASGASAPEVRFQPSTTIACADTPFGHQLMLGGDAELMSLVPYHETSGDNGRFREWVLDPPQGASGDAPYPNIDSTWTTQWGPYFADTELMHAIRADLNGDGKDEIWVAGGWPSNFHAQIRVGSFRRGATPADPFEMGYATEIGTASGGTVQGSNQFEFATGNISGRTDGIKDLVMMTRFLNNNHVRITVAPGTADGGLEPSWSVWTYVPPTTVVGVVGMAVGDFLLEGRDQIVLVTENDFGGGGGNRTLNYHLIRTAAPGNYDLTEQTFTTQIGSSYTHDNGGATIDSGGIVKMKVSAGDVAGDAAAEIIIHTEFQQAGTKGYYSVGQRVHHFKATRDADGNITNIELARPAGSPPDVDYDFSHLVRQQASLWGTWDAAVANIDHEQKAEIVFLENVVVGGENGDENHLALQVYRSGYHLTAGFRYYHSGRSVQFTDVSVGGGQGPFMTQGTSRWTFGDGSISNEINPIHEYASNGTYEVTLNLSEDWNGNYSVSSFTLPITVDSANASGGGLDPEGYFFQIQDNPVYSAEYAGDGIRRFDKISVDVGDMDRDGIAEIQSVARLGNANESGAGVVHSIWRLDYGTTTPVLTGSHRFEESTTQRPNNTIGKIFAIAADFDGDSVHAVLGGDCRHVEEVQGRNLVWVPPHFQRLQDTATPASRLASFGTSSSTSTSVEHQYGTFTSHDVSGYVGLQLGSDAIGVQASVKATAGYYYQAAKGGIVGSGNGFSLSLGHSQTSGDALLVAEGNGFDCYSYDVTQASAGLDPDSSVRICQLLTDSTYTAGINPQQWDESMPLDWAQNGGNGYPPPNWAPLTRDWANLALFKGVTSNAGFPSGTEAAHATDGKFTTRAQSQPRVKPYIEIDLGRVQGIADIRVFPVHGELAGALAGFRVYTSLAPMPTNGLPTPGAGVHAYAPDSFSEVTYDRWNIWTRHWDPADTSAAPGDLLKARYVRLQYPGDDPAAIDIGQIQVFGDVHLDPPFYPDAVCDPTSADGLFMAKVWDAGSAHFRDIEVQGDMLWSGDGTGTGQVWSQDGEWLQACANHVGLSTYDIWGRESIGGGGGGNAPTWSFNVTTGGSAGDVTSFESSTRVGAEFDLTAGSPFVAAVAGGSYEFSTGVTEEYQTMSYWDQGLDIGGSIGGFANDNDVMPCRYNTRPYGFKRIERSNTGYEHTLYSVDYTVPEGVGATAWTRAAVPARCLPEVQDVIFKSGFEATP